MSLKSSLAKAMKPSAVDQLEKLTASLAATDQRIAGLRAERGKLAAEHIASGATDRPASLDRIASDLAAAETERAWLHDAIGAARQAVEAERLETRRAHNLEVLAGAKRTAAARRKAAVEMVEHLAATLKAFERYRLSTTTFRTQASAVLGQGIAGFLIAHGDVQGQVAAEIFRLANQPLAMSLARFPGAKCSDLRLTERPELVEPLLAVIDRDDTYLLTEMEAAAEGRMLSSPIAEDAGAITAPPPAVETIAATEQPRSAAEVQATIGKVKLS